MSSTDSVSSGDLKLFVVFVAATIFFAFIWLAFQGSNESCLLPYQFNSFNPVDELFFIIFIIIVSLVVVVGLVYLHGILKGKTG